MRLPPCFKYKERNINFDDNKSKLMFPVVAGQDLNLRPSGYEPDELPNCSTPRYGVLLLSLFSLIIIIQPIEKARGIFRFFKIFCGGEIPGEKAALYFSRGIVYNKKNVENFGFWTWRQPGPQTLKEDACA